MGGLIEALGLNSTIVAQIFNFIVLFLFLKMVVFKPLVNVIEKRQQTIEENIKTAEEERKKAEALHQSYLSEMQKAKEEAHAVVQKAIKSGEGQAQQIIEAAKVESDRLKENALRDIEIAKEKAVIELRDQVATLSILVADKIIGKQITDELQHDLVQKFIKDAGDLPC